MDFSQLTRNKDAILNALYQDPKGGLIAKQSLSIVIPQRYEEADLADITNTVDTLGIFAIVVDNYYASNIVPARIRLTPTEISKVKYNDVEYLVLSFDKGNTICPNINLVKEETLGYYIYNNFIALGKVPWFMSPADMINLFERCGEYTGREFGASPAILQMIASMVMRDENNTMQYWRQTLTSQQDFTQLKPDYIPLRNVPYGARNTTAKLMGSYFDEGLNSALVNPSETTERVEELLRQ